MDYPYINYGVASRQQTNGEEWQHTARLASLERFEPQNLRYFSDHLVDVYDEAATIARPPLQASCRRPLSNKTGYIVCVYKVFDGDDGEKFERNWLYWTGEYRARYAFHFPLFARCFLRASLDCLFPRQRNQGAGGVATANDGTGQLTLEQKRRLEATDRFVECGESSGPPRALVSRRPPGRTRRVNWRDGRPSGTALRQHYRSGPRWERATHLDAKVASQKR